MRVLPLEEEHCKDTLKEQYSITLRSKVFCFLNEIHFITVIVTMLLNLNIIYLYWLKITSVISQIFFFLYIRNEITHKERFSYLMLFKRRPDLSGIEFIDEGCGYYLTVSRCFLCFVETLKILIIVRVTDGAVFDKKR